MLAGSAAPRRIAPERRRRARPSAAMWIAVVATAALATDAARAHSISLGRGEIVVEPNAATAALLMPGGDLLHAILPTTQALSPAELDEHLQRYAQQLAVRLAVLDAAGAPAAGVVGDARFEPADRERYSLDDLRNGRIACRVRYALAARPDYLTLRLAPSPGGPSHAAQLALAVRTAERPAPLTVVLTSRGNAETLGLSWAQATATAPAAGVRAPECFRHVLGTLAVADNVATLDVLIPLPILETFVNVPRCRGEVVTPQEQAAIAPALHQFFRAHALLEVGGRQVPPDVTSLTWLSPADAERAARVETADASTAAEATPPPGAATASTAQPCAVAGGCVRATLRFSGDGSLTPGALRWDFFNALVLEGRVTLVAAGRRSVHQLTTYAPTLAWPQPD